MKKNRKCGDFVRDAFEDNPKHLNPLPFRSWKTQNQIMCFVLIIISVLSVVLILCNYLLLTYSLQFLKESSTSIFERENIQQIKRYGAIQNVSTHQFFDDSNTQLNKLNQLYHKVQQGMQIQQPTDCLLNPESNTSYAFQSVFCYAFCDKNSSTNISQYQAILNLTSLITEYLCILNLQRFTYFTQKDESQFFALFNGSINEAYRPHQRPWYLDHLRQMSTGKASYVSEPYFSWLQTIYIAQTANLSTLNGEFDGVIAQDADLSNLPKLTQNAQTILANSVGDLIISPVYSEGGLEIVKFYNESKTGFSSEAWSGIISDCDNIHTVHNTQMEKDVLLYSMKMNFPEYYLIMMIDYYEYQKDQQELFDKIVDFYYQYLIVGFLTAIGLVLVTLTFQFIFIQWLQSDLKYLTYIAQTKIYSYKIAIFYRLKFHRRNSSVRLLYLAYLKLLETFSHNKNKRKGVFCQYLERLKYPINSDLIYSRWSKSIEYLRDHESTYDNLQTIQGSLKTIYEKNQLE